MRVVLSTDDDDLFYLVRDAMAGRCDLIPCRNGEALGDTLAFGPFADVIATSSLSEIPEIRRMSPNSAIIALVQSSKQRPELGLRSMAIGADGWVEIGDDKATAALAIRGAIVARKVKSGEYDSVDPGKRGG